MLRITRSLFPALFGAGAEQQATTSRINSRFEALPRKDDPELDGHHRPRRAGPLRVAGLRDDREALTRQVDEAARRTVALCKLDGGDDVAVSLDRWVLAEAGREGSVPVVVNFARRPEPLQP